MLRPFSCMCAPAQWWRGLLHAQPSAEASSNWLYIKGSRFANMTPPCVPVAPALVSEIAVQAGAKCGRQPASWTLAAAAPTFSLDRCVSTAAKMSAPHAAMNYDALALQLVTLPNTMLRCWGRLCRDFAPALHARCFCQKICSSPSPPCRPLSARGCPSGMGKGGASVW